MNFGPINQDGGWKRLNVAFSRARVAMTIFSSLHPEQIDLRRTSSEGVAALRDFLLFAEGRQPASIVHRGSNRQIKSGIMSSIRKVLELNGYQVETMIGQSDFHVDMAVVDPSDPTRYILAILLDGETYRSTSYTRDREIAQESVLKNLGWNIHRIWTVDWWDARAKEQKKLLDLLEQLKKESAERKAKEPAEQMPATEQAVFTPEAAERKQAPSPKRVTRTTINVYGDPGPAKTPEVKKQASPELPTAEADTDPEPDEEDENEILIPHGGTSAVTGQHVESDPAPKESEDPDDDEEETEVLIPRSKATPVVAHEKPAKDKMSPDRQEEDSTAHGASMPIYSRQPYHMAELEQLSLSADEFCGADMLPELRNRVIAIAEKEAPIAKDLLVKRLIRSCGIGRSSQSVVETAEKAIKQAKLKYTKHSEMLYYWMPDQNPITYYCVRDIADRDAGLFCKQELRSALCYVLQEKGPMQKEQLFKEATKVVGYARMPAALRDAFEGALTFARHSSNVTTDSEGFISLIKNE